MTVVLDTKKSNFWSQDRLWFHIWFIMTLYNKIQQILLQNKRVTVFYCKKKLLQNVSGFLLQIATVLL